MVKEQRAPRKRKGNDPQRKIVAEEMRKLISDLDLDFVSMNETDRAYMGYRLLLRGMSLQDIAKKMDISVDNTRKMLEGVRLQMRADTEEWGKAQLAINIQRCELVIGRLMPYIMDTTTEGWLGADRDILAALREYIKLESQLWKEYMGIAQTVPVSQHNHLHVHAETHTPTMERKSKLYDISTIEQNIDIVSSQFPEILDQNIKYVHDERIDKLKGLLPEIIEVDNAEPDRDPE